MERVIFIVGPTATGKTEVAYLLAKKIGAEIISCDSMLVYQEPKIATAKPPQKILSEVKHHFIDIISVTQTYSVYQYYQEASKLIKDFHARGQPVVVCGGTGLYFKALLDGIFIQSKKDPKMRDNLYKEAEKLGLEKMYQKLAEVDPVTSEKISKNDKKRIIRALEVFYLTGEPISEKKKEAEGFWAELPCKVFGLDLERQSLYQKINERTDWMFEQGIVDEVKELLGKKLSLTAAKIISINEVKNYLEGKINIEEARETIKKNTRNFAKRQLTWFRKDSRINWINVECKEPEQVVDAIKKGL